MKVMKFGGSSVKDAPKIKQVCEIILNQKPPVGVVFSAMKGITDLLIEAATRANNGTNTYRELITTIIERKQTAVNELFPATEREKAFGPINKLIIELQDILHGIELIKDCSPRSMDLVMSFGERLNCTLISNYLQSQGHNAKMLDTRKIIQTDDCFNSADVNLKATGKNLKKQKLPKTDIFIITGFIAATPEGVTTTLGRNGSDYTASIMGNAFNADCIEIWTDVDGVLSADPRIIPSAFVVPEISFEEAMELSFFGAEVIHPYTMIPAIEKNIPVWIKNTYNPSAVGTRIAKEIKPHDQAITGIASIQNVALINIEGGGMMGRPGIASEVFKALAEASINVIMISQASSEHSICLVCREDEAIRGLEQLKNALSKEIDTRKIQNFQLLKDLEIVAIIGENMRGRPGISGRLFSTLGKEGINVLAVAQGSSERNISFVIDRKNRENALKSIHKEFLENGKCVL